MIGVYIIRDSEGRAVYVGSSADIDRRLAYHSARAPWWANTHQVERVETPSRALAYSVERDLIKELDPPRNTVARGVAKVKSVDAGPVVRPRTEALAQMIDAFGSVAALAAACGVNHMTLSDVWREVHYPSTKLVARLVVVTGIPFDELFYVDPGTGCLDVATRRPRRPRIAKAAA